MPSANGYSPLTLIIIASVAVSTVMMVVLIVLVVLVRMRNAVVRHRREVLTTVWRNTFKTAYTGEPTPDPLPSIGPKDWFTVLQMFVQFHEAREKDRPRAHEVYPILDAMAQECGLDEIALRYLAKGDDAEKLLALNALGQMRDVRAFDTAVELVDDEGAELSRAAAQCAMRIQPKFIHVLLELVRDREDWVRARVEAMLKEIPQEDFDPAMARAVEEAEDAAKPRLLDYLRFCTPVKARIICKNVLDNAKDPETIAAALRSLAPLAGDGDRAIALQFCKHEKPIVLLSALRVLRKCVRFDDRELLGDLCAHRDYWVRLRAAEAIVQLYGDTGLAQEFSDMHPDRYAKDAIRQALAERKMFAKRRPENDRRGSGAPASAKA